MGCGPGRRCMCSGSVGLDCSRTWAGYSSSTLPSHRKHPTEPLLCCPSSALGGHHSSACAWAGACPEGKQRQGKGQGLTAHVGQVRDTGTTSCSPFCRFAGHLEERHRGTQPLGSGPPAPSLWQQRGGRGKGRGVNEHKSQTCSFLYGENQKL